MTTLTARLPVSSTAPLPVTSTSEPNLPRWHLYATAIVVGLIFFVVEHDLSISLADAFTQTADEMEVVAEGGNFIRRLAFPAFGLVGLALLLVSRQPLRINLLLALPIAAYLVLAYASLLWTDDRSMTMRRLIVLGCCTSGALGLVRRFSMRELCQFTLAVICPLVVIGILTEIRLGTFRPWAVDYRFSGSLHPNSQTAYLTALALAALGIVRSPATRRGRFLLWVVFAGSLVLMLLTKSRTGNAATFAAIASVFVAQTSLRFKFTGGLVLAWLASGGLFLLLIAGYDPLVDFRQALLLGRAEESDTLSGRHFIWPEVAYFIAQKPWLGYGYEAFWNPTHVETISEAVGWGLREAHNGYLDVLLSLGIFGLAAVLIAALAGLVAAIRGSVKLHDPAYALPLGMLVYGLIVSIMESGMVIVEFATVLTAACLLRMALFETPPPDLTTDNRQRINA